MLTKFLYIYNMFELLFTARRHAVYLFFKIFYLMIIMLLLDITENINNNQIFECFNMIEYGTISNYSKLISFVISDFVCS